MQETQFHCAHCGTLQGGRYVAIVPYRPYNVTCHVTCNRCNRGSVIYASSSSNADQYIGKSMLRAIEQGFPDQFRHQSVFPQAAEPRMISDLPPAVERAFTDAEQHMGTLHFRSAVAAYRTALERAIKLIDTEGVTTGKRTLFLKIEAFQTAKSLPSALIDLMHRVRDFGNDIHEMDEVSEADAKLASDCASLLLTYLFELPARVERAKARKETA